MEIINPLKSKQSKIIAVIILIIIIVIGYFLVAIQIQHQNKTGLPNLQNKCGAHAEKFISGLQSNITNIRYSYKYHYNTHLNKCYILIHGFGVSGIGTSDELVDITGNNTVADCESYNTASELNFCNYNGSKGQYSVSNFDDFVIPYMTEQ